jgi:hypothetical protein
LLVQDYVKFFVFLCGLAVIPVGIKSTGDFILLLFLIGMVGWALYTKDTA